jgi:hypothetical protein
MIVALCIILLALVWKVNSLVARIDALENK